MAIKTYNKLVRDRMPEIIKADGKEFADVMAVLFALGENLGYSEQDLINTRNERNQKRGGFKEGIILEKVYE